VSNRYISALAVLAWVIAGPSGRAQTTVNSVRIFTDPSAAAFTVVYRYGPSRRRARWAWLVPGGAAAALVWMGGSAGFSWYLNHVARLDATYGSLGAIIGFMLWVWFSVMVVLIGAEFSAEIEHQTAQDTTVGAGLPMGQRGAAMADTLGAPFVGLRKGAGLVLGGFRRRIGRLRDR